MTEMEYLHQLDLLISQRNNADLEALQAQEVYRNKLRRVDTIKDKIRQLQQVWINQQQEGETHDNIN